MKPPNYKQIKQTSTVQNTLRLRSSENVSRMMPKMMFRPIVVMTMKKTRWNNDWMPKLWKDLSVWNTCIFWVCVCEKTRSKIP